MVPGTRKITGDRSAFFIFEGGWPEGYTHKHYSVQPGAVFYGFQLK